MSVPGRLIDVLVAAVRLLGEPLSGGPRRLRDLLIGMPAAFALVALVTVTAAAHLRQTEAARGYWAAGSERLRGGDPAGAQLLLQKALVVQHDQPEYRGMLLTLAVAYERSGDRRRADALMESLAPAGVSGDPSAHGYRAIRIAHNVSEMPPEEELTASELEEWRWHLSHAGEPDEAGGLEQGPQTSALQRAWGLYYLVTGDLPRAADHLRVAAEVQPELWLQIARLESRMQDLEKSRVALTTARQRLGKQFARAPSNDHFRLLYATSLFWLGDLPEAEKLLKEGLARSDNGAFERMLAVLYVKMSDAQRTPSSIEGEAPPVAGIVGAAAEANPGPENAAPGTEAAGAETRAFTYLRRALEHDPGCRPALERLIAISRASSPNLELSRQLMQRQISAGESSALAHFTLGTLDWLAGDPRRAELHMRQALALDGALAVVANNLAFLIATDKEGDLEAALALACQAVESDPSNAAFLDTRGRIHEKRGDLAAAAVDYQRALESSSGSARLQQKLAEIYETLGDTALAAQFRRGSPTHLSEATD